MFWMIAGSIFAVVLTLAWINDHRRADGRKRYISPPTNDSAVGDAKAMRYFRIMGGMGPTKR
ncbi:MAG: hypothetical protein ACJ72O_17150 [Marmoricola sp.]